MAGRKSKYNTDIHNQIVQTLGSGTTMKDAALYAGIDETTLHRWIARYANFASDIKKAQSQARIAAIARINKAGRDGSWQADAWFLERSDPSNWGRKDKLIIEGDVSLDTINKAIRTAMEAGVENASDIFNDLINEYAKSIAANSEKGSE